MVCRRLRGNLTVYKIMRGIDMMDTHNLYTRIGESKTKGDRFKVREAKGPEEQFIAKGDTYLEDVERVQW